jgi:arsenate reductase-like glutaredoxin family protein
MLKMIRLKSTPEREMLEAILAEIRETNKIMLTLGNTMKKWMDSDSLHHKEESNTLKIVQNRL